MCYITHLWSDTKKTPQEPKEKILYPVDQARYRGCEVTLGKLISKGDIGNTPHSQVHKGYRGHSGTPKDSRVQEGAGTTRLQ